MLESRENRVPNIGKEVKKEETGSELIIKMSFLERNSQRVAICPGINGMNTWQRPNISAGWVLRVWGLGCS